MNPVPDTVNTLAVDVNAIKIIMEIAVNIGMSVRLIRTVAYKENVSISMERHCQRNNVTVIWDGLALAVTKVNIFS